MTTTARLTCWVDPDQRDAFETTFADRLTPILARHGLRAPGEPRVSTAYDSWAFCQSFEIGGTGEIAGVRQALVHDPAWQALAAPADGRAPLFHGHDLRIQQATGVTGRRVAAGRGHSATAGPGRSVRPGEGFRHGLWHSLGPPDGLPGCIAAVAQDRQGDLWFATCSERFAQSEGEGIWRYDGGRAHCFTTADGLPDNAVTCVAAGRSGALWIGTMGGLVLYDGQDFTTWTTDDGLLDDRVSALLLGRQGELWIGTLGGLCRYDGESFTHFTEADGLVHNRVTCMIEDRDGEIWFGAGWAASVAVGVSRCDGERLTNYTRIDGLASEWVLSLMVDRGGTLWLGHNSCVSTWDGADFRLAFDTDERQVIGGVTSMVEDGGGRRWYAVWGQGLRCIEGEDATEITARDGLITDEVFCLLEDVDGQLWAGTGSAGVSRHPGSDVQVYTTREGLVDTGVCAVCEDRSGRLWCGTRGGVNWLEGGRLRTLAEAGSHMASSFLVDRQNRLWLGLWGRGVGCWDGRRLELHAAEPAGWYWVVTVPLLEDRDGVLWFRTTGESGGLSRLDGDVWARFDEDIGLEPERVRCMVQDGQGQLWFGGDDGLSRYDGRRAQTFTTDEGLVHDSVRALVEDEEGCLWIGTRGGLSRFDGETFASWTTADGLPHSVINALLVDDRGHLWIGTEGGLSRFDGRVFQQLTRSDGLRHPGVWDLHQDHEGTVWLATGRGLVRYRPASSPPRVGLRAVAADRTHDPSSPVRIPVRQKVVTFRFEGASLTTPPGRMAYVYRLEGHDPEWRAAYADQAQYRDLPVGEYRFQVRAVDRDLNTSETADVAVSVEPDLLVESLTATLRESGPGGDFVGRSAALQQVLHQLHQVAPADLTVLISGETGTGKGLAARTLHELSPRDQGTFIQVNCGAIPETLIEAELFGHEKGAFTGAVSRRLGKVELAAGGTLFLDEIGDMPLEAQVKLLRLLEERTFERVGSAQVRSADVRVVAATNRDLRQMISAGTFREDLFFRLQGFEVHLPPLRERREDIPLLALYFIGPRAAHLDKEVTGLSRAAEGALLGHDWPGNVRELQHAVERAVVVCRGPTIDAEDLALGGARAPQEPERAGRLSLEEVERRHIRAVLEDAGWVVAGPGGAAASLGLKESTLRARMKRLGIRRP